MLRKLLLICLFFAVLITGCKKSGNTLDYPSPPRHSLHAEGELQLHREVSWVDSSDKLKTKIWVVNTGSETAVIETGPCAFNVMAYTTSEEDRKLVWYNKMPENYICPDELITYSISPNDTMQFNDQLYISGNNWHWSVPHGKWKFVIEAKTEEGKPITVHANTVTIN
ncbi:MAG: hypothetical protein HUJ22_05425 [Gracilimonas sp.]|uniref:hypothetical protein n=1 Tax=Gracilimonas sp. TaxID=1974203 RepID=UPI0019974B5B|nr:hypothetical protein [Gracilimonas sp.]MBD3615995.1 hypothetical protein [Gracilimonas sp.]